MTLETILSLWPDAPPGAEGVTVVEREEPRIPGSPPGDTAFVHVTRPTLWHFRAGQPSGVSLLVVPGGGYRRVVTGFGARAMCAWFAARGIDVFVLRYRLPSDGWAAGPMAPLQDAQRALCLIHANAIGRGLDSSRVGVLGMSAGGHLAAGLAMRRGMDSYAAVDAADEIPTPVPFLGLLYPVVTMGAHAHAGSRDHLLGPSPDAHAIAAHSLERHVTGAMPPTFLATGLDDDVVDPVNTLLLHDALRTSRIPAELHLFERGGHGFTLQSHAGDRVAWPEAFLNWAAAHWQQG
jgi:acetyl esterase/lipase